jgi:hypothetical protein
LLSPLAFSGRVAYLAAMSVSHAYLVRKLSRPLPTKDGGTLRTVAEARAYIVALPDHRELRRYWQHAARLILEQADIGDVSRQVELALFLDYKLNLEDFRT